MHIGNGKEISYAAQNEPAIVSVPKVETHIFPFVWFISVFGLPFTLISFLEAPKPKEEKVDVQGSKRDGFERDCLQRFDGEQVRWPKRRLCEKLHRRLEH